MMNGGPAPQLAKPSDFLDREGSTRRLALDPGFDNGQSLYRQVRGSPWTMVLSLLVLLYCGTTYNVVFLGRVLPTLELTGQIVPLMLFFNLFWGMALWSYLCAHLADPGVVPAAWRDFVMRVGPSLDVVAADLRWQPGKPTMCKKCNCPRPERTHHCHVCGVCILRMDHHCPWINNCVGFKNYKQFLLLVYYCVLSAAFGLLTAIPQLLVCATALWQALAGSDDEDDPGVLLSDAIPMLAFGIVTLIFLALLLPMMATHTILAIQNVTSIESHYDDEYVRNPFDLRGAMDNLETVLGVRGWDWLVPLEPRHPLGDGVAFQRFGESACEVEPVDTAELSAQGWTQRDLLWRKNYGVKSTTTEPSVEHNPEFSPLTHLVQWWKKPDMPAESSGEPSVPPVKVAFA